MSPSELIDCGDFSGHQLEPQNYYEGKNNKGNSAKNFWEKDRPFDFSQEMKSHNDLDEDYQKRSQESHL